MRLASGRYVGKRESARQFRRRQPPRQLHQRERIAARLRDDPVAHLFVERPRDRRGQQRAGIAVARDRRTSSSGKPGQL